MHFKSIITGLLATLTISGLIAPYHVDAAFTQPEAKCANTKITTWKSSQITTAWSFNGDANKYPFVDEMGGDSVAVENGELKLKMRLGGKNSYGRNEGRQAIVSWTRKFNYGRLSAKIKTACTSPGVVTAFMFMSPEGDEIDFEWVGKNRREVQTNYYYNTKYDGPDYTKGQLHPLNFDTTSTYHTYTFEWTPSRITWYVDGAIIRVVNRLSTLSNGVYRFPSRPGKVSFNVWDGGMGAQGTAEWAGTPTDWSNPNKVYTMSVKDIDFQCSS
jgi:beta-glucanase (GH16 family)